MGLEIKKNNVGRRERLEIYGWGDVGRRERLETVPAGGKGLTRRKSIFAWQDPLFFVVRPPRVT